MNCRQKLIQTFLCLFSKNSAKQPPHLLAGTHTHTGHTLLADIMAKPRSCSTADGIRGCDHETQGSYFPYSHPSSLPLPPLLLSFLSSSSPSVSPAASLCSHLLSLSFVFQHMRTLPRGWGRGDAYA